MYRITIVTADWETAYNSDRYITALHAAYKLGDAAPGETVTVYYEGRAISAVRWDQDAQEYVEIMATDVTGQAIFA